MERERVKHVYKVLAYLIAVEVAVQAAAAVWFEAGLTVFIGQGGVLDKTLAESGEVPFIEVFGLVVHGLNGMFAIPALALILLICSFWAKVPGAVKAAGLVLLLVVLQVTFGIMGGNIPLMGAVHGINALLLFAAALYAARLKAAAQVPATREAQPAAHA
ncbi:hypothetical protein AB0F88_08520 [Streptosporangium sp. NPDC023963]|uniref:hypothetical protein n=1 Tax=Streptosporangium sp. NPDC023963 TaxID=3155608 RepID=UPI003448C7BB